MFTSLSERVSGGSSLSLENTYHVQTNHETIGYLETFLSIGKGCLFWQLNKSTKNAEFLFLCFLFVLVLWLFFNQGGEGGRRWVLLNFPSWFSIAARFEKPRWSSPMFLKLLWGLWISNLESILKYTDYWALLLEIQI